MFNIKIPKELAKPRSNYQQLFTRFIMAVLIDLTVLNFFNQYSELVSIETFTVSFLVAILLQILLLITIDIEHRVSKKFKNKSGAAWKTLQITVIWTILLISKVIILEGINFIFGSAVLFTGPLHGIVIFIIVVIAILVAEQLVLKLYNSLA